MRTRMITHALTALTVVGLSSTAASEAVSGERALLNRVENAGVIPSKSEFGPIDAARALLGRIERGLPAQQSNVSGIRVGGEQALLGRNAS